MCNVYNLGQLIVKLALQAEQLENSCSALPEDQLLSSCSPSGVIMNFSSLTNCVCFISFCLTHFKKDFKHISVARGNVSVKGSGGGVVLGLWQLGAILSA